MSFANFHGWAIPYGGRRTNITKEELNNFRYFNTRSRKQWDYTRIDDSITSNSEFRKYSHRPDFDTGTRTDNSQVNYGYTSTPSHYRLQDYFDEYTKPGVDRKWAAAIAVKEQWDANEHYYPGESWQQNRPAFRSVPKELLNRDTWYTGLDMAKNFDKVQSTTRVRSWCPQWPPPGLKVPKMQCKREFEFGAEDPSVVGEIERYYWFKSWQDSNMRFGVREFISLIVFFYIVYFYARIANDVMVQRSMFSNLFYPGRNFLRSFGTPKDWEKEPFWWQRPLDEFPNQGVIYVLNGWWNKYPLYIQQRDERERLESQL